MLKSFIANNKSSTSSRNWNILKFEVKYFTLLFKLVKKNIGAVTEEKKSYQKQGKTLSKSPTFK